MLDCLKLQTKPEFCYQPSGSLWGSSHFGSSPVFCLLRRFGSSMSLVFSSVLHFVSILWCYFGDSLILYVTLCLVADSSALWWYFGDSLARLFLLLLYLFICVPLSFMAYSLVVLWHVVTLVSLVDSSVGATCTCLVASCFPLFAQSGHSVMRRMLTRLERACL